MKMAKKHDSDIVMYSAHRFDEIDQKMLYDALFTLEFFDESFDNIVFNHQSTASFFV